MILSDLDMPNASGHATVAKPDGATDESNVSSLVSTSGYDVRADADLDGAVTNSDKSALSGAKFTLGRGFMSRETTFNRRGYAGYENDGVLGDGAVAKSNTRFWHVRHRVLDSTLGRWSKRDPLGNIDGASLVSYVAMRPLKRVDPTGLLLRSCGQISDFAERILCCQDVCDQVMRLTPLGTACCYASCHRNNGAPDLSCWLDNPYGPSEQPGATAGDRVAYLCAA